jgi:hypothetical protein
MVERIVGHAAPRQAPRRDPEGWRVHTVRAGSVRITAQHKAPTDRVAGLAAGQGRRQGTVDGKR